MLIHAIPSFAGLLATGGRSTTNLLDPTLTHIIVTPNHQIRFTQLVQLTRKPRLRKLVGLTWSVRTLGGRRVGND